MLTVLKGMDWGDTTKVIITQTYCDVKEDKIFGGCPNYKQYLCKCEFGNKTIATTGSLTSGNTTSCGCKKEFKPVEITKILKEDLTGKRFNHLTVIKFAGYDHCGNRYWGKWLCKCDCGIEKEIREYKLKKKDGVKSCGCMKIIKQEK